MAEDIAKRIGALEKRFDAYVKDQNKVNQRTHDEVIRRIEDQNKVNLKAHEHIGKLEKRLSVDMKDLNKVNQSTHDNFAKLEKRFGKIEKKR